MVTSVHVPRLRSVSKLISLEEHFSHVIWGGVRKLWILDFEEEGEESKEGFVDSVVGSPGIDLDDILWLEIK